MEYSGNGQSGTTGNFSWDYRNNNIGSSNNNRYDNWSSINNNLMFTGNTTSSHHHHQHQHQHGYQQHHHPSLYAGTSHVHPDPHLTCLKLGKRHYFEDGNGGVSSVAAAPLFAERHVVDAFPFEKRGRSYVVGGRDGGFSTGFGVGASSSSIMGTATALPVPRCQVEGCNVPLVAAKDYHRRHKVCEMHSKAPKVVVLGIEQRFCQQCSRFHVVSEFDDSKRSCRRRLAGHNERRRKSSSDGISSRNLSHGLCVGASQDRFPRTTLDLSYTIVCQFMHASSKIFDKFGGFWNVKGILSMKHRSMSGRLPYMSPSTGRALSLLSSKTTSWESPTDLSSRSSAALRELIAENRAAVLARQLFLDQGWHHQSMDYLGGNQSMSLPHISHQHQAFTDPSDWQRFHDAGAQVTLDLMQESSSPFGFLQGRTKNKDEDEECCPGLVSLRVKGTASGWLHRAAFTFRSQPWEGLQASASLVQSELG
ncbi:hypothetical protein IFM89_011216 [Coptis chinensis]|uniref:SBP-type domain-containing protein n=1 Tax=Coptis chinensis TaxID=261450 RepID=A0A835HMA0_9MAGN|nr:hypothetical protein IFM89_011216 [Coptis chinensis]